MDQNMRTVNTKSVSLDSGTENTRNLSQDMGTGNSRNVSQDTGIGNSRNLSLDTGTGNSRNVSQDTATVISRNVSQDTAAVISRNVFQDTAAVISRNVSQDSGTNTGPRNTINMSQDKETENTKSVSQGAETRNTRIVSSDIGTVNTKGVSPDTRIVNTKSVSQDTGTENTKSVSQDTETVKTNVIQDSEIVETRRVLQRKGETGEMGQETENVNRKIKVLSKERINAVRQMESATQDTELMNQAKGSTYQRTGTNTTPKTLRKKNRAHSNQVEKAIGATHHYQPRQSKPSYLAQNTPQRSESEKHKKGKSSKTPSISPHKRMKGARKNKESNTQPGENPGSLNSQTSATSKTRVTPSTTSNATAKKKQHKAPQTTNSTQHNPHRALLICVLFSGTELKLAYMCVTAGQSPSAALLTMQLKYHPVAYLEGDRMLHMLTLALSYFSKHLRNLRQNPPRVARAQTPHSPPACISNMRDAYDSPPLTATPSPPGTQEMQEKHRGYSSVVQCLASSTNRKSFPSRDTRNAGEA
uniref:Uncharacterized protein n=1 Tax=Timema bartmani TaxID=61472 RepID=A0A7R9F369_9NEOP|nr:unnamed protein product [Timema bartmani]